MASILIPVVAGSMLGSVLVSRLPDDAFEFLFGVLVVPLVVLSVVEPPGRRDSPPWTLSTTAAVFFGIGVYGGAIHVRWGPALLLAAGFTIGGWKGAEVAVRAGVVDLA